MKHALLRIDRNGHNPIRQLGEKRAEPKKKRFSTSRPFRANDQISFFQQAFDVGSVLVSFSGQCDGFDGGDELGEPADAIGDAADLASERNGDHNRVKDGAVVADEEDAGVARLRGRGRAAFDSEGDAHEFVGVESDVFREGEVEVDAEEGEGDAEGEPEES